MDFSYMFGGGDGAMNLEELLLLEKHLEYWISQIRSAKVCIHVFMHIFSANVRESEYKMIDQKSFYVKFADGCYASRNSVIEEQGKQKKQMFFKKKKHIVYSALQQLY